MDSESTRTLIVAGACVIALFIILPVISSAAGVRGPELPGIPGVGKQVCDVNVEVTGIWNHIPIPGWMDEVKIDKVTYSVQNWRYIAYSLALPLGWSEGDGEMMVKWELVDNVGNPIQHGEQKFSGTQAWSQSFILYKLEPGSYKLKVEVWMNTKALLWNEWILKDGSTVDLAISRP
ncbi:MAG: hypothetical protein QXJ17_04460 [Nitrososphaeria archaeon]